MVATTNQKKCLALPARAVKFPDYSIGTLYVHECGTEMPRRPSWWNFTSTPWHFQGIVKRSEPVATPYWKRLSFAQGTVEIPSGHELAFVAHEECQHHYDTFAVLSPSDLQGFRTAFINSGDLRFIGHLTGLRYLFLISEALTNHDLSYLRGLSALEILMLMGCRNVDTSLSGLKELTKLRQLELCAVELPLTLSQMSSTKRIISPTKTAREGERCRNSIPL